MVAFNVCIMFKPYPSFMAKFSLKVDLIMISLLESVTDPIDMLIFATLFKKKQLYKVKFDLVSTWSTALLLALF